MQTVYLETDLRKQEQIREKDKKEEKLLYVAFLRVTDGFF